MNRKKKTKKNTHIITIFIFTFLIIDVKNPPVEGITNYFEIMSKNSAGLTIDYKRDIRTLTIVTKLPNGIIKFNSFTVTPDNGNPLSIESKL